MGGEVAGEAARDGHGAPAAVEHLLARARGGSGGGEVDHHGAHPRFGDAPTQSRHGDEEVEEPDLAARRGAQQELARLIKKRYGIEAAIPDYLEEVTLEPGREPARVEYPEKAAPRIDWDFLIADMETRFAQLRERRQAVEGKAWVEQTEFRDRQLAVNRNLAGIISEI